MDLVLAFLGVLLILIILWDAFETIILPRRVARRLRLAALFYRSLWWPWSGLTQLLPSKKQRENYLGLFGPLSLITNLPARFVGCGSYLWLRNYIVVTG